MRSYGIDGYMPKAWQPLNFLVAAEQALASARDRLASSNEWRRP
jgi:hypothetical protein